MRTNHTLAIVASALMLGACATRTVTSSTGEPAPGAPSASAPAARPPQNAATRAASTKANLAIEKLRLGELFKGTPVVIALLGDGSLRVDVPLEFSFDAGKAAVKPPLAAVLDRVANGQLNEITHLAVSAPGDAGGRIATLAADRAAGVRDRLAARGIAASRIAVVTPVAGIVRVLVTDAPAP